MASDASPEKAMDDNVERSLRRRPSLLDIQEYVDPGGVATFKAGDTNSENAIETRRWALKPTTNNDKVNHMTAPTMGFTRLGPHTLFTIPERPKQQHNATSAGLDAESSHMNSTKGSGNEVSVARNGFERVGVSHANFGRQLRQAPRKIKAVIDSSRE